MTWIAVTTPPAKTRKVRKRLRRLGMTAYVPAIVSKRIVPKGGKAHRRRRITVLMPYVLVEVPDDRQAFALWLHGVLSVKDVQGVIQSGETAALIPLANVEMLRTQVRGLVLDMAAIRHKAKLRKGDKARILSGSLAGRAGTVAWVSKQRVGLEATLFGSSRVIVVEKENLEAA